MMHSLLLLEVTCTNKSNGQMCSAFRSSFFCKMCTRPS